MNTIHQVSQDPVSEAVYEALNELGLAQHLSGYKYVAYGVQYLLDRLSSDVSITKVVYPAIADAFGSKSIRVERCMRHAISTVFDRTDLDAINKYFGNSIDPERGKATNSQFLHTVARHVHRSMRN